MDRLNCVICPLRSIRKCKEGDAFGTDTEMDVHTCYSVAPEVIVTVMADI